MHPIISYPLFPQVNKVHRNRFSCPALPCLREGPLGALHPSGLPGCLAIVQQNISSTYLNQFISKVELLMLPDLI